MTEDEQAVIAFAERFPQVVNWSAFCEGRRLSDDFVEYVVAQERLNWSILSRYVHWSVEQIKKYEHFLDFSFLSKNDNLSLQELKSFEPRIGWFWLLTYRSKKFWNNFDTEDWLIQNLSNWYDFISSEEELQSNLIELRVTPNSNWTHYEMVSVSDRVLEAIKMYRLLQD